MIIQFANLIENSPTLPGVYMMYDADETLLYVGKAKNIRARLRQYTDISKLEWHKRIMRSLVASVNWQTTATESDALVLEQELIKTLKPKYNIMMTDGKMYPMMALTKHEFPRLIKFRKKISQKKDVFGPYPSVSALNEALKTIQKVCQLRTCTDSFMNNRTRPCLLHQIGRCSAPCMNGNGYEDQVKLARKILSGDVQTAVKELSDEMRILSKKQEYETAAQIRDKISALTTTANRGRPNLKKADNFSNTFSELEKWLGVKIEFAAVFDNSHLFGKNPVGAMIVFGRNGFIKTGYRHFKLRDTKNAGNDIAMMQEFLSRAEKHDLIIVDGGRAQWNIAKKILGDDSEIMGVVKGAVRDGDEHFIMPDGRENYDLAKDSPLFLMLRRVRDEAHRFAISFHRTNRAKTGFSSALDEIDGVGAARKKALLNHFGSVKQIADAHESDIVRAPGISKSIAQKIYNHFH
ncbi:MAG: excinuclease ABC subunit UvrC [Alphaproteobacteria bacterium]